VRDSIFITGAHGFVGRRLVECIDPAGYAAIRRLVRRNLDENLPGEPIVGDLLRPSTYRKALAGCQTVLHLAALTGRHSREDYFRVNTAATAALVSACEANAVRRFLYVSTIAVNYPDLRRYYYAQSKQGAESAVRRSGMRWAIVRPTMIFGPGAPVLRNLSKLALGRRVPVLDRGRALVQPIYIDDLVALLLSLIENDRFEGQIIEAGGPEVLPIEELLQRIRQAHGRPAGAIVSIPFRLARPILAGLETLFRSLLPLTAGQLTALASDGTADVPSPGAGVDEALRRSLEGEAGEGLRQECRTFARYLTGHAPGAYIEDKYEEFHRTRPEEVPSGGFDARLVGAAARGPRWTRLADTYASRFAKTSALRKKVALVLALLESAEPSASRLDLPAAHSRFGVWWGAATAVFRYAVALAVSIVLFAPLGLAFPRRKAG
jgi:nucleoside-diphosphate-sugar epimerase